MKAFIYQQYGTPDVLQISDVPKPTPKDNEILIQTKALSINPAEHHALSGKIWLVRAMNGLRKPKNPILGADVSGVVKAIGKDVKGIKVGDNVLGRTHQNGLAEYVCLEQEKATVFSDKITYEQAAAMPLGAITALVALRDKGKIAPNQKVLINGASGGIGTFAVQLAKHYDTYVTGICSGKNRDLVLSLGADNVIDYTIQNLDTITEKYDLIVDLVGNLSANTANFLLNPNGKCIMVGFTNFKNMLQFLTTGGFLTVRTNKKFITIDAIMKSEDLAFMVELMEKQLIKSVIDKVYDFKDIPKAFEHLGSRRAKGKLVIHLSNDK